MTVATGTIPWGHKGDSRPRLKRFLAPTLMDGMTLDREGNLTGWFKGPDLTLEMVDTALGIVRIHSLDTGIVRMFSGVTDLRFEPTTPHQWQRRRRWRRFSARAIGEVPA